MRFLINALVFSTSIASLASACIYKRAMDVESFTYEGENGPLVWHHVNRTAYGACAHGQEQSPINIETHLKFKRADAILAYPSIGDFTAENNGHTIQFTPKNATKYKAKLGGGDYQLLQFHFHTPSEHRLNREHYPLEVHFVHQNPSSRFSWCTLGNNFLFWQLLTTSLPPIAGALAAVGVFFDIGHVENGMFLSGIYPYLYDLEEEGAETAVPRVYLTYVIPTP